MLCAPCAVALQHGWLGRCNPAGAAHSDTLKLQAGVRISASTHVLEHWRLAGCQGNQSSPHGIHAPVPAWCPGKGMGAPGPWWLADRAYMPPPHSVCHFGHRAPIGNWAADAFAQIPSPQCSIGTQVVLVTDTATKSRPRTWCSSARLRPGTLVPAAAPIQPHTGAEPMRDAAPLA